MEWHAIIRAEFALRRTSVDESVVEEFAQHAAASFEEARADGHLPDEAERYVRALITSWCAATDGPLRIAREPLMAAAPAGKSWFAGLGLDIRLAFRLLRRQPGFSFISIAMIALAIAATTSIFSVVNGVVLKPLPWTRADGLVRVLEVGASRPPGSTLVSTITYWAWAQQATTVDGLGGWFEDQMELAGPAGVERVRAGRVTASLFPLLGVAPVVGAHFTEADSIPPPGRDRDRWWKGGAAVILSHGFWQERFGGATDVLGKTLTIEGLPRRIVGVMPQGFELAGKETRLWVPIRVDSPISRDGNAINVSVAFLDVLARLKPGFTARQAAAEAAARVNVPDPDLAHERQLLFGGDAVGRIDVIPMLEWSVQDVKPALWVLLASVVLLFAAAIGNVANMQLARAVARQQDVAVRAAIGAGSGRLARQLFIETLPITIIGGTLGFWLTASFMRALPALLPEDFPRLHEIAIDGRVLLVVTALTLLVCVLMGLLPARLARRVKLSHALVEDGAASVGHGLRAFGARPQTFIITGQVAVAALLLVGAALLSRSFMKLVDVDRGYQPANLMTAHITHEGRNSTAATLRVFYEDVLARLRATPGVTYAGLVDNLPLTTTRRGVRVFDPKSPDKSMDALTRNVSPDYFASMGMRVTRGRGFTARDVHGSEQVMLVNGTFAARYLAGDGLNAVLSVPFHAWGDSGSKKSWWRVIGVVADVNNRAAGDPILPEVYATFDQLDQGFEPALWVTARTTGNPAALAADVRAIVGRAGADVAIEQVMTMESRLMRSLARPRLYAVLLGGFAGFALLIAGIGLFGGLSYGVTQRTREIGVRTALGATPWNIVGLVVKQGALMTAVGLTIGFLIAAWSGRYLSGFLFGVTPADPATFVVVGVALTAIAAVACGIPARRAAKVDPIDALRH